MSRNRLLLLSAAALLGVGSLRVALWQPRAVTGPAAQDGYVRIPGVVHVHTTLSDGAGTPDEVTRAARATGTRFVVITDHNNVDAKPYEGWRDGVLVIAGSELSTTAGHILGLGITDPTFRFSGDALDGLEDIRDLGGFAFAAHPLSPRADLRFTGWDLPGSWGLELVNGDSEWRSAGLRILPTLALYGLNRRFALTRLLNSPDATLARWDALLANRDVAGLAGADAHGFPSYGSLFRVLRTHVLLRAPLTGRFEDDRTAVLDALQNGQSYVGLDGLAPADDFFFVAEAPGRRVTMGETIPPVAGLRLKAGGPVPDGAHIALLRNGTRVADAPRGLDVAAPQPGVYRIEVRLDNERAPWILSNPIYVFDDATRAERARRAAWPSPPPAHPPSVVIDNFDNLTAFQAAADPGSAARQDVLDPHGGPDGRGAGRLEFRLGTPTADLPSVFAALIDRTARDLRGHAGLVFSVRADGEYPIWVQVRDENRAAEDGTEWWGTSVRTLTAWQRFEIPFARLHSTSPKTDGHLDLDKIRALVFVVDRGSVKPGTRGTIWLDDLGAY